MKSNRERSEQAQDIIFCRKVSKPFCPCYPASIHKHLGRIMYCKLSFKEHLLKSVLVKANKIMDLFCKFQLHLPKNSILTIHKFFFKPHLDCLVTQYIIKPLMSHSIRKLDIFNIMQLYNAIAIAFSTVRGTSLEKLN